MIESNNNQKKKRGRPTASNQIDKTVILDIAIQEFAKKGFDGAKKGDIAKAAGIANSFMNYHFESKEDLWKLAVTHLGEKLNQKFIVSASYLKDLSGLVALKAFTRQFIYFSAEYPEFYKIVFHEMCTQTERADWLVESILRPLHKTYFGPLTSSKELPEELRNISYGGFSSIIIGAANVYFIHEFEMKKLYGVNPRTPEEIEKHADLVIDLLKTAESPPPSPLQRGRYTVLSF